MLVLVIAQSKPSSLVCAQQLRFASNNKSRNIERENKVAPHKNPKTPLKMLDVSGGGR